MSNRYVCSQCGKPISPAQNRCPHCGSEIDWQKAVGRVVHLGYKPAAQRRRARRWKTLLGLLFALGLMALAVWIWNLDWTQQRWAAYLGPDAYLHYEQGVVSLKSGELDQARFHFARVMDALGDQRPEPARPTPSYTLPPPPTPAPPSSSSAARPPSSTTTPATPTSAPNPGSSPPATPTPTPAIQATVIALIQSAESLADEDPCSAADLMAQALADTPDIEARRQELAARCQGVFISPLPEPPPAQTILFTTYDVATGFYAVRAWMLGERLPQPVFIQQALQPAWGMEGDVAYRSDDAQNPGIYVRQKDGSIRRVTKGGDDSRPRWSPDGRQMIFTSAQRSSDQTPHLYLVDVATRSVEALGRGQNADWSREGRIVFHGCDAGGENCGLMLLDPVTLQQTRLTDNPSDNFPAWSPDGRYVAFMSSGRSDSWDVFILDVDTGFIIPTSLHPAEDGLPAWSPDGRTVAMLSNRAGDWAIYAWHLDDLTTERLIPVAAALPNWQQAGFDWGVSR